MHGESEGRREQGLHARETHCSQRATALVKQDEHRQRSRLALGDELHDALQQLVWQP